MRTMGFLISIGLLIALSGCNPDARFKLPVQLAYKVANGEVKEATVSTRFSLVFNGTLTQCESFLDEIVVIPSLRKHAGFRMFDCDQEWISKRVTMGVILESPLVLAAEGDDFDVRPDALFNFATRWENENSIRVLLRVNLSIWERISAETEILTKRSLRIDTSDVFVEFVNDSDRDLSIYYADVFSVGIRGRPTEIGSTFVQKSANEFRLGDHVVAHMLRGFPFRLATVRPRNY